MDRFKENKHDVISWKNKHDFISRKLNNLFSLSVNSMNLKIRYNFTSSLYQILQK